MRGVVQNQNQNQAFATRFSGAVSPLQLGLRAMKQAAL